jgi:hypothetical protein
MCGCRREERIKKKLKRKKGRLLETVLAVCAVDRVPNDKDAMYIQFKNFFTDSYLFVIQVRRTSPRYAFDLHALVWH